MTTRPRPTMHSRPARAMLIALAALLAWDASGLDRPAAQLFGDARGFPLHEHPLLTLGLHTGGRLLSWALVLVLCASVWWPVGWLRRVSPSRRVQLVLVTLLSVLAVALLKSASRTSCPWDLADFGGVARHVSHWSAFAADGGAGRCFPAGHASAGFAFVGGWFALRDDVPVIARRWLIGSLVAGLVLGLGQQMRGAHFMSHTLWAGWLCAAIGFAFDIAWRRRIAGASIGSAA